MFQNEAMKSPKYVAAIVFLSGAGGLIALGISKGFLKLIDLKQTPVVEVFTLFSLPLIIGGLLSNKRSYEAITQMMLFSAVLLIIGYLLLISEAGWAILLSIFPLTGGVTLISLGLVRLMFNAIKNFSWDWFRLW